MSLHLVCFHEFIRRETHKLYVGSTYASDIFLNGQLSEDNITSSDIQCKDIPGTIISDLGASHLMARLQVLDPFCFTISRHM